MGLLLATLGACSGGYDTSSPISGGPDGHTVTASPSLLFGPSSLSVKPGDAVTFAFGSVPHNVFFDAQSGTPADIAGQNINVSISRVFATPGTYTYSCHIHPSMRGTIVVR